MSIADAATTTMLDVAGITAGYGRTMIVRDVSLGIPELEVGYSHEPQDWNYWNREFHVYRSGFLDDLPGPLTAVRCWGLTEVAADESWLWLEALEGAGPRRRWSHDDR